MMFRKQRDEAGVRYVLVCKGNTECHNRILMQSWVFKCTWNIGMTSIFPFGICECESLYMSGNQMESRYLKVKLNDFVSISKISKIKEAMIHASTQNVLQKFYVCVFQIFGSYIFVNNLKKCAL